MSRGKICSQTSHAVLGVFKELNNPEDLPDDHDEDAGDPVLMAQWASMDYPKQTFQAKSIQDLYRAEKMAQEKDLYSCCVHDAGRTEVAPMTPTVCAFGPCTWEDAKEIIIGGKH